MIIGHRVARIALTLLLAGCASGQGEPAEWSSKASSSPSGGSRSPGAGVTSQPTSDQPESPAPTPSRAHGSASAAPPVAMPATTQPVSPDARIEARRRALALLDASARDSWELVRANTIEALTADPTALEPVAARGLVDENRGVRFVAVASLVRVNRCDMTHLIEPLLSDPSLSVRAASIAMLASCGRQVDQSPLAEMIFSENPEIRANAYLALGQIGNRSAAPMVRASLGRGLALTDAMRVRIVELQAAECLVRLGETQEIEPVRAALFAPGEQGELTVLACQIIGRLADERSRPLLYRLVEATANDARPVEVRIAAIDALGRLGGDPGLASPLRGFLFLQQPVLRAQAASAAGNLRAPELLGDLIPMLDDPDPVVRVAAAGAILRLTGRSGSTEG